MREVLLSLILVLAPLCHVQAQSIVFPGPGGVVAAATGGASMSGGVWSGGVWH